VTPELTPEFVLKHEPTALSWPELAAECSYQSRQGGVGSFQPPEEVGGLNLQSLLEGKIKLGHERTAKREIENRVKYILREGRNFIRKRLRFWRRTFQKVA